MLHIGSTRKTIADFDILPKRGKYLPLFEKINQMNIGEEFNLSEDGCTAKDLRSKVTSVMSKYKEFKDKLTKEGATLSFLRLENNKILCIRKVKR